MTIPASDHNDNWHKLLLTAHIPNSDPDAPIYLHAKTSINGTPVQVIERNLDINTTAVTIIPSTKTSPAVLIWQQLPPGYEEPIAQESNTQSKYQDTTQSLHQPTSITLPLPTLETPDTQHTLLYEVLTSHTPPNACMRVYDRAGHHQTLHDHH